MAPISAVLFAFTFPGPARSAAPFNAADAWSVGRHEAEVAKGRVLEGHKRVGKRFIPPMKQLPSFRSYSYVTDMLPELIWLGLLTDALGFVRGARLFEQIAGSAKESIGTGRGSFAFLSTYQSATETEQASLLGELSNRGALEEVRGCLSPLNALYDAPIAFLGLPEESSSEPALIQTMYDCVANHINKYETPGVILNGMVLLSRLSTGTIKFAANVDLPDFNAVLDSPGSEEAKGAAGFIRAHAIGEFGMEEIEPTWARYFWRRSYELSPCEFAETDDE